MNQAQKVAILRVLREADGAVSSKLVAEGIGAYGFDLSPRSVRLYLEEMERQGLVAPARRGRRGGRRITAAGEAEINDALVLKRVGLTAAKVDELACRMTLDTTAGSGRIVLNLSLIHASLIRPALAAMLPVFRAGLGMGLRLCVLEPGTQVGEFRVPAGQVAIGTVCSVTANGALLARGVPTTSKFGGVLEYLDGEPIRFTDVIYYDGTSLDPLEIFIKGGLTHVSSIPQTGRGRIGASFREVPTLVLDRVQAVFADLERLGLGRILVLGKPNQPLLGFPVSEGRTGLIVPGGLNPVSALEEVNIAAENFALAQLFEARRLETCQEVAQRFGLG